MLFQINHYLVDGSNLCLEVIGSDFPTRLEVKEKEIVKPGEVGFYNVGNLFTILLCPVTVSVKYNFPFLSATKNK